MNTPDTALTLKDWMPLIAVGVASLFVAVGWFVVHKTSRNRDLDNWRRTTLAKAFTDISEAVGQISARLNAGERDINAKLIEAKIDDQIQKIMRNEYLIRATNDKLEDPAKRLSNSALKLSTEIKDFQSTWLAALADKDNPELIDKLSRLSYVDILMTVTQLEGLSQSLTTESMAVIDKSAGVKPIKALRKFTRNVGIYFMRVFVQIYRSLKRKFGRSKIDHQDTN